MGNGRRIAKNGGPFAVLLFKVVILARLTIIRTPLIESLAIIRKSKIWLKFTF
jgi:hypothetical protein